MRKPTPVAATSKSETHAAESTLSFRLRRLMLPVIFILVGVTGCGSDPGVGAAVDAEILPPLRAVPGSDLIRRSEHAGSTRWSWTNSLGEGGLREPNTFAPPQPQDCFTRLTGVMFPPDRPDVLFFGVSEPGERALDPAELLDVLVTAYRTPRESSGPSMSIDPTPELLQEMKDLPVGAVPRNQQKVVYYGGIESTVLGAVACEADLIMKYLSLGQRPEAPNRPFTAKVPGHRSVLEILAQKDEASRGPTWHRFWIQPQTVTVAHSEDGRVFLPQTRLEVLTQLMIPGEKQLLPGQGEPGAAAQEFQRRLTEHYDDYALEFEAFHKLRAFAQLTSLADSLSAPRKGDRPDVGWLPSDISDRLAEHRPAHVKTIDWVAPLVAKTQLKTTLGTRTIFLNGGVTLRTRESDLKRLRVADNLQGDVLEAVRRDPERRAWSVTSDGNLYRVVSALPKSNTTAWQRDLKVGALEAFRHYRFNRGPDNNAPTGWQFGKPTLTELERRRPGQSNLPPAIVIEDETARTFRLDQTLSASYGGNPLTLAYWDLAARRRLYCYKNGWELHEGTLRFFRRGDGSNEVEFGSQARIVRFDAGVGHKVEAVESAEGRRVYRYAGARLTKVTDGDRSIELLYDAKGRWSAVVASDGQKAFYRYDEVDRLRSVVNERQLSVGYGYEEPAGKLNEIVIESGAGFDSATAESNGIMLRVAPSWDAVRSEVRELGLSVPEDVRLITVGLDTEPGRAVLQINDHDVNGITRAEIDDFYQAIVVRREADAARRLRELFEVPPESPGGMRYVIHCQADGGEQLALALREAAPEIEAYTANHPARALGNLARQARNRSIRRFHVVVQRDGLQDGLIGADQLRELASVSSPLEEADGVIIVGDNRQSFRDEVARLGTAAAGRPVILVSCGQGALTRGMTNQLLDTQNASGVIFYDQPLSQALLIPLVRGLMDRLQADPALGGSLEQLRRTLREIGEEIYRDAQRGTFPPGIDNPQDVRPARLLDQQIGRILVAHNAMAA